MPAFFQLLKRFRRDEQGVFAVFFALIALVLIAMSGAVVDFTQMQTARSRLQTVLDSAALALQARMDTDSDSQLKTKAQTLVSQSITDAAITATVLSLTTDHNLGKLNVDAELTVPTAFVQLVGVRSLTTHLRSEVTRSSSDVEVSLALDNTLSMNMPSTKITALKTATNNLIDDVIKADQPPTVQTYTKMALVPYSYGVNVGTYGDSTRDVIQDAVTINGAGWSSGSLQTVSALTNATTALVTTSGNHGFVVGDTVYFSGLAGMTQLNGKFPTVATVPTTKTFTINLDTRATKGYGTFDSKNGTPRVIKCLWSTCEVVVTTGTNHNLAANDKIYITNVSGMKSTTDSTIKLNSVSMTLFDTVRAIKAAKEFVVKGDFGPNFNQAYTSGGTVQCLEYGCRYFNFNNLDSGASTTFTASNCVTERTGAEKYTDAAPGPPPSAGAALPNPVGIMYPSASTNCVSQTIVPLTWDKTKLHATVNAMSAAGSTAGHIGLAWAWYMIAPKFGYLWPTAPIDSRPAAYKRANLIKAVILMTDGKFNTQYCNGVISSDSDVTIDPTTKMNNCAGTNGESVTQAQALCTSIKDPDIGVLLYTVGFDIGSNSADDVSARSFLSGCATDVSHFYKADSASDLDDAFKAIAQNLSDLRLSK